MLKIKTQHITQISIDLERFNPSVDQNFQSIWWNSFLFNKSFVKKFWIPCTLTFILKFQSVNLEEYNAQLNCSKSQLQEGWMEVQPVKYWPWWGPHKFGWCCLSLSWCIHSFSVLYPGWCFFECTLKEFFELRY